MTPEEIKKARTALEMIWTATYELEKHSGSELGISLVTTYKNSWRELALFVNGVEDAES